MMKNQTPNSKPAGSLRTTWDLKTYEVWGNAKYGYDINNVFPAGSIELRIPQTRYNVGTPDEFIGAFPTTQQIKRAVGTTCRIDVDGDDLRIEVTRTRDGYPIGEMRCTSHASLSPVIPFIHCAKCGQHFPENRAFESQGTGREIDRTFSYCSEHCRDTH